jgi:choline dehydrogenase-like flavoprotein
LPRAVDGRKCRITYDVIIIGSGPGGASVAHRLGASGKRILLLERGDYLPRSRANWDSQTVFVDGAYQAPETCTGPTVGNFIPACNILLAAIPRFTARRCFGCGNGISTRLRTRTAFPRRGL